MADSFNWCGENCVFWEHTEETHLKRTIIFDGRILLRRLWFSVCAVCGGLGIALAKLLCLYDVWIRHWLTIFKLNLCQSYDCIKYRNMGLPTMSPSIAHGFKILDELVYMLMPRHYELMLPIEVVIFFIINMSTVTASGRSFSRVKGSGHPSGENKQNLITVHLTGVREAFNASSRKVSTKYSSD